MLNKRRFGNKKILERVEQLRKLYTQYLYDYALNPKHRKLFEERLRHAEITGRDPGAFLDDEEEALNELIEKASHRHEQLKLQEEARRRRLAGEGFADKIIKEFKERIEPYPALFIHENADQEVAKLYGAIYSLFKEYWDNMDAYLRRAFPQRGQLDRMDLEQRFWRITPAREGRPPADLERYYAVIAAPMSTNREKAREAQECVKKASFFLHDVMEVFGRATNQKEIDEEAEKGVEFVRRVISDFRLKDLKRR